MWLHTTATASGNTPVDLGYELIKSVELQIGGTKIDKHYGRWLHIWRRLTLSDSNSTRGSSESTLSPTFFNHFDTVASVTDSPNAGTTI